MLPAKGKMFRHFGHKCVCSEPSEINPLLITANLEPLEASGVQKPAHRFMPLVFCQQARLQAPG